jgi:hypothetical protein
LREFAQAPLFDLACTLTALELEIAPGHRSAESVALMEVLLNLIAVHKNLRRAHGFRNYNRSIQCFAPDTKCVDLNDELPICPATRGEIPERVQRALTKFVRMEMGKEGPVTNGDFARFGEILNVLAVPVPVIGTGHFLRMRRDEIIRQSRGYSKCPYLWAELMFGTNFDLPPGCSITSRELESGDDPNNEKSRGPSITAANT